MNVDEADFFGPAFQVRAGRATAAHLFTGSAEHSTELEKHVILSGSPVLAVAIGIEILEFDPSAGSDLTARMIQLAASCAHCEERKHSYKIILTRMKTFGNKHS
jgi:hypothetical protein